MVNGNNVFIDKCTGKMKFFERPEAKKLFELATTQPNGEPVTIVIDSIDRLGRSLIDILKTIEVFTASKINLKSLKEGFETLSDGKINPVAQIVIGVMGSIAEFERSRIRERQSEGIVLAKAQGKYRGRKIGSQQSKERLLERHAIVVQKLKRGLPIRDIAEVTGKCTATIMKVKKALAQ